MTPTHYDHDLEFYDRHNPGDRFSNDPQKRLYGRCGCYNCRQIRQRWADILSPLDRPGRDTGSMASVNICDRCGSLVRGAALGSVSLVVSSESMAERISKEICPGCVGDLVLTLEVPISPAKNAYREPWARPAEQTDSATLEQLAGELFERLMKRQNAIESKSSDDRRD